MNIILNRKTKSGNRIEGELRMENGELRIENGELRIENGELRIENGPAENDNGELRIENSIENSEFLIPQGTYEIAVTWSPKFKKMLPLLLNVPGRTGIRIHTGSKPEHSKGCILVTKQTLERIIDNLNRNTDEKHFITVGGNI